MLLLGSHVGMSGKDMLVNSVKEALSYDANTFMVYTGAPQNTRRKDISELCIQRQRKLWKNMTWQTLLFMHLTLLILPTR